MKGKMNIDYISLIKSFLKTYRLNHTEAQTLNLVKSILNREENYVISKELDSLNKDTLSSKLGLISLDTVRNSDSNKEEVIDLIPIIIQNNIRMNNKKKQRKLKLNNKQLKRISIITTALMISLGGYNHMNKANDTNDNKSENKVTINNLQLDMDNLEEIIQSNAKNTKIILNNTKKQISKSYKRYAKFQKDREKKIKIAKKKSVLYNFKKYKTIDEILKRQKELESLNLKNKDKLYKDCALSAPIQWFIYEQASINKFPADLIFSTIYTESRGNFNSSGEESYNKWNDSYDLGITQQNTKSSLISFCKHYNINYNDDEEYNKIYKLMKDNDYINIMGCFLEYKEIASRFDSYNPKEFAGCYNGWLLWRKKKTSVEYVDIFLDAYYNTFTSYHTVTSKKEAENKRKDEVKILKKLNSSQIKQ